MVDGGQLPLSLRLRSDSRLANFIVDTGNAVSFHALQQWLRQPWATVFFLSGPPLSGRTHLLQAAAAETDGALYLPLAELVKAPPAAVCEGLERPPLLALDDIDAVCADPAWAEALFHLFNRRAEVGHQLLVAASVAPAALDCALADLRSRLGWGGSFALRPLGDEGRARLLQSRAAERGLLLGPDTAAYILHHVSRDSRSLLHLIDRLDGESLAQKRRLTIPFVKSVIHSPVSG